MMAVTMLADSLLSRGYVRLRLWPSLKAAAWLSRLPRFHSCHRLTASVSQCRCLYARARSIFDFDFFLLPPSWSWSWPLSRYLRY